LIENHHCEPVSAPATVVQLTPRRFLFRLLRRRECARRISRLIMLSAFRELKAYWSAPSSKAVAWIRELRLRQDATGR
jgi:hypothetical protein